MGRADVPVTIGHAGQDDDLAVAAAVRERRPEAFEARGVGPAEGVVQDQRDTALGAHERGAGEPGQHADLLLLQHDEEVFPREGRQIYGH